MCIGQEWEWRDKMFLARSWSVEIRCGWLGQEWEWRDKMCLG
jgi:hypothetical protein